METSKKVDEYRQKLDKSLLAHNLVDEDALRTLVQDQILCSREGSVEKLVQKRTTELSNLLEMLRSGSEKYLQSPRRPYASWKVKQDNEKFRSMYREGPSGTPVHTFFVDGYVDAPLDSCLYLTCQTSLYPMTFPESRFHKVTVDYFKKIRHGEQLSLLRLKLAWPLSDREILLHHSVLEHYEDDLVVLLMNSVTGKEEFCNETDGFTNDEIPKPTKALRIDLIGGIVFQKVSETKTFLRLILNADLKINFVPQAVVNFITGKLSGTAFKLYDKWVTKISQEEGNDSRIMENPVCERIRDALYPNRSPNKAMGTDVSSHDDFCLSYPSDYDDETSSLYESVIGWDDNCSGSDEEDDTKGVDAATATAENDTRKKKDQPRVPEQAEASYLNKNNDEPSPRVGLAIGTLEEAVSAIRDGSPMLEMNGSIPVILINMKNLRPIATASDMSRMWQDRNLIYTQGDLVTSYTIKDGMLMRSDSNKAIHQNQQQIFVVDAKDACDGKNDERKKPRKLRNWALPCIYAPDVSQ
ncbi:hypothetical protein AKJ16_DCAP11322 [Drosera capensis]